MRDPVARIESHLRHGRARGWGYTIGDLSDGVDAKLIEISKYASQLDPYVARFGRDSVLLLRHEDMRDRPRQVTRRACEFLGVDPDYSFTGLGTNHNKGDRTVLPEWYRHFRRSPAIRRAFERVPAKRWIARRVLRAPAAEPVRLPDRLRDAIRAELREDMRRLRDRYGVDISEWSVES
jgi:hypothetical protein